LFLKVHMQMQDLLDNGEARKKQEETEFARIDAEAKDERDKEMGFRGKVCPLDMEKSRMGVTNISQILDVLDGPDARLAGSKPASEYGLKDRVRRDPNLAVTRD
jgi:hypothetical protein